MYRTIFLVLVFMLSFWCNSQVITKYKPQVLYEQPGGIFDIDSLRTLSIEFYNPDYHKILVDNWFTNDNSRLPAKLKLNNEIVLDSVAIRYKGNSTFYITNSYGVPKLPWNIDINRYVSDQNIMGVKKLKLANAAFDPTFVKEILGYSIYQKYLPAPEANYMKVNVQGDYLGLYINTETVDKLFLTKHFDENDGVLVKCDPIQRYGIPGPSGKSDLKWLGNDSTLYYNHYELKSKYGWKEFINMIDVINNHPEQLDSVLNVDRILWAFAVNTVISNFDTYNGVDPRNYYMYQTKDDLFQMIPWDVSESFINAMLGDFDDPNDYYEYDPYKGSKCWWYPLNSNLIGDPTTKYGKIYTAHIRTILEESADYMEILDVIKYLQAIAEEAVKNDPNNYWNMQLFSANVFFNFSALEYSFAGIMYTVNLRNKFLLNHPEILKEPPRISDVDIFKSGNSYFVKAHVANTNSVELMVCTNAYNSKFKSYNMNDEGINGDEIAADGIFTAPIIHNSNGIYKFYIRSSNNNAIHLSPERAEYEFYTFLPTTQIEIPQKEIQLSVYPNPTQDNITILADIDEPIRFSLISSMGEIVKTGVLISKHTDLNLSALNPGIYFLKIENKVYKVIKN